MRVVDETLPCLNSGIIRLKIKWKKPLPITKKPSHPRPKPNQTPKKPIQPNTKTTPTPTPPKPNQPPNLPPLPAELRPPALKKSLTPTNPSDISSAISVPLESEKIQVPKQSQNSPRHHETLDPQALQPQSQALQTRKISQKPILNRTNNTFGQDTKFTAPHES